jgi:hypothetical protein
VFLFAPCTPSFAFGWFRSRVRGRWLRPRLARRPPSRLPRPRQPGEEGESARYPALGLFGEGASRSCVLWLGGGGCRSGSGGCGLLGVVAVALGGVGGVGRLVVEARRSAMGRRRDL